MPTFFCCKLKGKEKAALDALKDLLFVEAAARVKDPYANKKVKEPDSDDEKEEHPDNVRSMPFDISLTVNNNCTEVNATIEVTYHDHSILDPLNGLDLEALKNVLAKDYNTWTKTVMKYLSGGIAIMGAMGSYATWAITTKHSDLNEHKSNGATTLIVAGVSLVASGLAYVLPRCIGKYCSDTKNTIMFKNGLTQKQLHAFYAERVALGLSDLKHNSLGARRLITRLLLDNTIDDSQSSFLQKHYEITENTPLLRHYSPLHRGANRAV